ncbi:hypothetical protein OSB04_028956 [Centaurea solstitialis]|uniref:Hybrid signal transduction histidine kinase M n=1 Tax=Centaurea solstitialis TaxID=347529 RepID=A0AA38W893_9ASTR|nr:hypothetical protein OSB04_028956 [Centaurea solstitialis]
MDAPPHKEFGITNIKTYVPLVLDLDRLNYDAWRELFTTHCVGFDVIDHIDDSIPKSTEPLETLFRDNKDAKSMQIDSDLRNVTMGDLTVTAYCTKIKAMAGLLANLNPASAIFDKHLVIYTINGLSSKFDSVANIIRYRSPLPTFNETRSMLLMEEQRMSSPRLVTTGNSADNSSSPTILHTGSGSSNRQNNRRLDRRHQQQCRRHNPPPSTASQQYG